jgi:hypothetical protein
MSIFRTIKKLRDCNLCTGTGKDRQTGDACPVCEGTGKIEVSARVSQAAATRAMAAVKTQVPPRQQQAARERLEDHEPGDPQALPQRRKEGKVGAGIVDEDAS